MTEENVQGGAAADGPPPSLAVTPLPVIPIDEEEGTIDVDAEDAADAPPLVEEDSLAELARAEAELEAIDAGIFPVADPAIPEPLQYAGPTRASRRAMLNRGNPVWGIVSFWLAVVCWSVLLVGWFVPVRGVLDFAIFIALITALAAIVFGIIGRRKSAARKRALAGRFMAWMTPGVVSLFVQVAREIRWMKMGFPFEGGGILAMLAILLLEAVGGLFMFVIIDSVLE